MLREHRLTPIVVHPRQPCQRAARTWPRFARLADAGHRAAEPVRAARRRQRLRRRPSRTLRATGRPARHSLLLAPARPRRRRGPLRSTGRQWPQIIEALRTDCQATRCLATCRKLPGPSETRLGIISRRGAGERGGACPCSSPPHCAAAKNCLESLLRTKTVVHEPSASTIRPPSTGCAPS